MPSLMRQLKNPMTENYLGLKKQIFDYRFPWYWQEGVTEPLPTGLRVINGTVEEYLDTYFNPPFYSHQILGRPWMGPGSKIFPYGDSPYIHLADDVLKEIFQYNDIDVDTVFRINVNCVRDEPNEKQLTFPHVDHPFPHSNMLIFLSDVGGKSIVQRSYGNDIVEESHEPKEDDIIIFGGDLHYHKLPERGRRIVLVVTFHESDPKVTASIVVDAGNVNQWSGSILKEYEDVFAND